jgi:hypothetical protein
LELQKAVKSWKMAKVVAVHRTKWKSFMKALCSIYENGREW